MRACILGAFFLCWTSSVAFGVTGVYPASMGTGDRDMTEHLVACIERDPILGKESIEVSAGVAGCQVFSGKKVTTLSNQEDKTAEKEGTEGRKDTKECEEEKDQCSLCHAEEMSSKKPLRVLLVWQWLDALKELDAQTVVVVPQHAYDTDGRFQQLANPCCPIEGVLSTKAKENMANVTPLKDRLMSSQDLSTEHQNASFMYIVVLAGDVQQEDGSWKTYTASMMEDVLAKLPKDQAVLFLGSPRTDKNLKDINDSVIGRIKEGTVSHAKWCVIPFQAQKESFFPSALKACLEDPTITLFIPEESVSMLSDVQRLGIKVVCYPNPARTASSGVYVASLNAKNRIVLLKDWKNEPLGLIEPQQDQGEKIVNWLKERLKAGLPLKKDQ